MADATNSIQIWKLKNLIKTLKAARGNGCTLISAVMPPGVRIARFTRLLNATATNLENIVNPQSFLAAITSAQERLGRYDRVPPSGLVLYTGTIVTDDGKEENVTIDYEPFRPIKTHLYNCSDKFLTATLDSLLARDEIFGFIVMDGNSTLFGKLACDTRSVLYELSDSRKNRLDHVKKTAEIATRLFINRANDQPILAGLILAGTVDDLIKSDMFHPKLKAKILNVVQVSCGGENGFDEAIRLSSEILDNVKFSEEKRLIGTFIEGIRQGTGKYVFGMVDTLKALEMRAVETLIVWENLDMIRYVMKSLTSGETVIKYLNKEQETNQSNYRDGSTGAELEVEDKMALLEWFASEYRNFGCTLEIVTNKSQEGYTFYRVFDGIGGILRCQLV